MGKKGSVANSFRAPFYHEFQPRYIIASLKVHTPYPFPFSRPRVIQTRVRRNVSDYDGGRGCDLEGYLISSGAAGGSGEERSIFSLQLIRISPALVHPSPGGGGAAVVREMYD